MPVYVFWGHRFWNNRCVYQKVILNSLHLGIVAFICSKDVKMAQTQHLCARQQLMHAKWTGSLFIIPPPPPPPLSFLLVLLLMSSGPRWHSKAFNHRLHTRKHIGRRTYHAANILSNYRFGDHLFSQTPVLLRRCWLQLDVCDRLDTGRADSLAPPRQDLRSL